MGWCKCQLNVIKWQCFYWRHFVSCQVFHCCYLGDCRWMMGIKFSQTLRSSRWRFDDTLFSIPRMPVLKRIIEPKNVSRRIVPPNTSNELEFISNSTLAHVIFQLSSLSKHSEDLFGELHRETCCILYRTSQLNERIEHLKLKIVRLNPTVEEGMYVLIVCGYVGECMSVSDYVYM